MSTTKADPIDTAVGIVVLFVGYPLAILYGAWVTTKLWGWFVMPTFTGAPALSMAVAAGLELLVMHLRPVPYRKPKDETALEGYGYALAQWFLIPTLTLVIASAIHAWFLT